MTSKVLFASGIALALVAGAWVTLRPDRALRVAAGVAAHHVCSMSFVGKQDPGRTYTELVIPMIGRIAGSLLTPRLSREANSVEVSSPFRILARADFTPGFGCRLSLPGNLPLTPATSPALTVHEDGFAPATTVETTNPYVRAALDRLFAEQTGATVRNVKALVIVKDGRVVAERYAPGFDVHSPLISFSIAKSFTNAFLGMLVGDGRLRVDQPLAAPEWRAAGDRRQSITIEDLLRMRSGLDAEESESALNPVAQMLFLHADMAGYAAGRPAKDLPGKAWEYTSANTLLLDRLIGGSVGGGTAGLRDFARRRLFDPLGMGDITMEVDGRGTFVGSTYVYASARDYARFGLLYLNDGVAPDGRRLLPEGWVAWSRKSTLGVPYGAGFWTNDGPSLPAKWRVEGGFPKDGFYASGILGQRIYIVPSERLVVARFGYSAGPDFGIEQDVALIHTAVEAYHTTTR